MAAKLVYLKLELKRAFKRLPHMAAGAIVLMAMLGTIAFAASKLLYGEATLERVTIGVVLPEEDRFARQLVRMLGTYDSVRSVCEFSFMDSSEAKKQLRDGEIFGIMNVPEGLVQGIMDGTNIPVTITLPQGNALENRVFKELTSAGARTLGSAQAGIYAGDQLLLNYDLAGGIGQLEADLNRIYMAYSLPRAELFEHVKVSATGDVDTLEFYGISAFVLYLLLAAIPVSGYLAPESPGDVSEAVSGRDWPLDGYRGPAGGFGGASFGRRAAGGVGGAEIRRAGIFLADAAGVGCGLSGCRGAGSVLL